MKELKEKPYMKDPFGVLCPAIEGMPMMGAPHELYSPEQVAEHLKKWEERKIDLDKSK